MTRLPVALFLVALFHPALRAAEPDLARQLRDIDDTSLSVGGDTGKQLPRMLFADARARRDAANRRETQAWHAIKTRQDWERYRDPRIAALRSSLGTLPPAPERLNVRVTRRLEGDGYRIENLVYESRPNLWVTANLYLPAKAPQSMPGIIICHSHHNPKTQGELQDMGMTWARLGCAVLIMDQLGHGERRQHPFVDEKSYPGRFRPGRQDYYFRYNVALQLHLVGESLVGWMAHDMMRGVELLLSRGVDRERIVLLGSVAGGGDPAAVTAALDRRISVIVPFNFGGPQPETTFPLPANAEDSFNYAGGGSWESTRNLRLSARDGFLPWVIVGSTAPRRLIHAHEFAWDGERDPVWKRYQKIYQLYNVPENLAVAHGRGKLSGQPPESTHCNNIGPEHRKMLYPPLKRWLGIPIPEKEYRERRPIADLLCLTAEVKKEIDPWPVWKLSQALAEERLKAVRKKLTDLDEAGRRKDLQERWAALLGTITPASPAAFAPGEPRTSKIGNTTLEYRLLRVEPGIHVPLLLLLPPRAERKRLPVVVGVCQEGKQMFLKQRSAEIAELLQGGAAVCLLDVRGTGESKPEGGRGRTSAATSISATELMLGQTLLGSRLRDLRSALAWLRSRPELDGKRLLLWGESFAPVNPPDARLEVPLDAEKLPQQSEPLGGLLVLLAVLYEDDLRGVYGRGGLVSFASLLEGPFLWVPHDAVIPGALTAGDLPDLASALRLPIRLDGLVDGLNRAVSTERARSIYRAAGNLQWGDAKSPVPWMLRVLGG